MSDPESIQYARSADAFTEGRGGSAGNGLRPFRVDADRDPERENGSFPAVLPVFRFNSRYDRSAELFFCEND